MRLIQNILTDMAWVNIVLFSAFLNQNRPQTKEIKTFFWKLLILLTLAETEWLEAGVSL